jgi:hypothetical protein
LNSSRRLKRVKSTDPGISRVRRGRGFSYVGDSGDGVSDADTLERIHELSIPPAWTDVWICREPMGHLQAAGTDAAGRRQYLYHERWRERRDREKFERMIRFAESLPALRDVVSSDLRGRGLGADTVLACAVRLLDVGLFRVGSDEYAKNGSFGLATLRKEHVRASGRTVRFDFTAKSGVRRTISVSDPRVASVIRRLKRRSDGGDELLVSRAAVDGSACGQPTSTATSSGSRGRSSRPRISGRGTRPSSRRFSWRTKTRNPPKPDGNEPSLRSRVRWRPSSGTRPSCPGAPTSILASWTATRRGRLSRCRGMRSPPTTRCETASSRRCSTSSGVSVHARPRRRDPLGLSRPCGSLR